MVEHSARGQRLLESVVSHCMHRSGIGFVVFQFGRYFLFFDEDRRAQRLRIGLQFRPSAQAHIDHGFARLKRIKNAAQALRHRLGRLGVRIGKNINQFAADEQLVLAKHRGREHHRRRAHAAALHAHIEHVVIARRREVFQAGLAHIHVALQRMHGLRIRHGQSAPVARYSGVYVH